jgi:hypothetical protein
MKLRLKKIEFETWEVPSHSASRQSNSSRGLRPCDVCDVSPFGRPMLNNNVVTQLQKQSTHFNLSWRNGMSAWSKTTLCARYCDHTNLHLISFKIVISKFNTKPYQIWGISDSHESSNPCQQVSEVFEILSTQVDPVQRIFWKCVDVNAVAQVFKQIFLAVNTVLTF